MPISGIARPGSILISKDLRLWRYDGGLSFALPWYQEEETVWQAIALGAPGVLARPRPGMPD